MRAAKGDLAGSEALLERIAVIHRWRPEDYRPFLVDGRLLGRIRHDLAAALKDYPRVFRVCDEAVTLSPDLEGFAARSAALAEGLESLAARGAMPKLRGELYAVTESWSAPDLFTIDRGAVPLFGLKSHGVHVNGFRRDAEGLKLWIGKRAADKPVAPGKLDHMVAGGQGHGLGIMENVVKEAAEEADVPEALARQARPVGAISYVCEAEDGLRNDTLFCFDLEVPADFTPRNTDGEIEDFRLMAAEEVLEILRAGEAFKFNVAAVMIDFMLRHGVLTPDGEARYAEIAAALHGGGSI